MRVEAEVVEAMTAELRHRGPDASGLYHKGAVALGHRRLSVIDTSEAANQPLANEDGSVRVVYNGEIYNYRSLTEELGRLGHRFSTRSDTEVIVHAWEEFGVRCLERFRGMFAFALYDANRHLLFLARDRLGKKPLYYSADPTQLAFASEIKALRKVPGISWEFDLVGLDEYVAYGNTLGETTIYKGIRRLPPAHYLLVSTGETLLAPRIERYWEIRPDPDPVPTETEWIDEIDRVLTEAVRLRLISDVPLGAFLSGGIDSSLVVAYMAKLSSQPVKTFCIGFREPTHDESRYAQEVAQHLGTEHLTELVSPNAIGVLETLVDVFDEPFGDESAIPTFYLSAMARRHVTVALSGDGGDENFLGYVRYPYSSWMNDISSTLRPLGRKLVADFAESLPYSSRFKRPLDRLSRDGFDLYNHAIGYSDEQRGILHADVRSQLSRGGSGKLATAYQECPTKHALDRYAYLDLRYYLPDDVLVKVDRVSMHHSLEVRCPLLDQELVDLAARIPSKHKLRWRTGKRLLRRLLQKCLPERLIDRPKMGFGVPLVSWFRAETRPLLNELVNDETNLMWRYFDRKVVSARIRDHMASGADLHAVLWRALFFYHWCNRHHRL